MRKSWSVFDDFDEFRARVKVIQQRKAKPFRSRAIRYTKSRRQVKVRSAGCVASVRHVKMGKTGLAALRRHLQYLEREAALERSLTNRPVYSNCELENFRHSLPGEKRIFKLLISPEGIFHLDPYIYIHTLMAKILGSGGFQLEGIDCDWMAVLHTNTRTPHYHIVVRGLDYSGHDVWFARNKVIKNLRFVAAEVQDICMDRRKLASDDREEISAASRLERLPKRAKVCLDDYIFGRPDGIDYPTALGQIPVTRHHAFHARLTTFEDAGLLKLDGSGHIFQVQDSLKTLERMRRIARDIRSRGNIVYCNPDLVTFIKKRGSTAFGLVTSINQISSREGHYCVLETTKNIPVLVAVADDKVDRLYQLASRGTVFILNGGELTPLGRDPVAMLDGLHSRGPVVDAIRTRKTGNVGLTTAVMGPQNLRDADEPMLPSRGTRRSRPWSPEKRTLAPASSRLEASGDLEISKAHSSDEKIVVASKANEPSQNGRAAPIPASGEIPQGSELASKPSGIVLPTVGNEDAAGEPIDTETSLEDGRTQSPSPAGQGSWQPVPLPTGSNPGSHYSSESERAKVSLPVPLPAGLSLTDTSTVVGNSVPAGSDSDQENSGLTGPEDDLIGQPSREQVSAKQNSQLGSPSALPNAIEVRLGSGGTQSRTATPEMASVQLEGIGSLPASGPPDPVTPATAGVGTAVPLEADAALAAEQRIQDLKSEKPARADGHLAPAGQNTEGLAPELDLNFPSSDWVPPDEADGADPDQVPDNSPVPEKAPAVPQFTPVETEHSGGTAPRTPEPTPPKTRLPDHRKPRDKSRDDFGY